jgi:hypothetical protein
MMMQGLDAKQQRTVTRNNVVGIFWKQCIDASSIFQVVLSTLRLLRWAVVTALRIRTWQHSAGGGGQVRACFLCPRGVPGGKAQDHNIWRTREPFTDFSVENTNRPSSTMKHGAQNNDAATLDEEGVDTVINSRKYCTYVRNACLVDTHFPLSFIRNELWSPVSHSRQQQRIRYREMYQFINPLVFIYVTQETRNPRAPSTAPEVNAFKSFCIQPCTRAVLKVYSRCPNFDSTSHCGSTAVTQLIYSFFVKRSS